MKAFEQYIQEQVYPSYQVYKKTSKQQANRTINRIKKATVEWLQDHRNRHYPTDNYGEGYMKALKNLLEELGDKTT